jgi:putative membrane protein
MYLYLKAIHLIGVVCWFAGLFYIVRLFIYHIEANEKPEAERKTLIDQFKIMERRLWKAITVPSMIVTTIAGGMLLQYQDIAKTPWLHLKFVLLLGLFHYHFKCGAILKKLAKDTYKGTSKKLRLFNEVSTILLVAIIMAAVTKNLMDTLYGFSVFFILILALFFFFRKVLAGKK